MKLPEKQPRLEPLTESAAESRHQEFVASRTARYATRAAQALNGLSSLTIGVGLGLMGAYFVDASVASTAMSAAAEKIGIDPALPIIGPIVNKVLKTIFALTHVGSWQIGKYILLAGLVTKALAWTTLALLKKSHG